MPGNRTDVTYFSYFFGVPRELFLLLVKKSSRIKIFALVRILNSRKKLLNSGKKWDIEKCDFGMQNCQKILESRQAEVKISSVSLDLQLDCPVRNAMSSRRRTTGIWVWRGL